MACRAPIAAIALIVGGCSWISPHEEETTLEGSSPKGGITTHDLQREVRQLADRTVARMSDSSDQVEQKAQTWDLRRRAQLVKVRTAMSVYDAVTRDDPLRELLELTILIELGVIIWVEEGEGVRIFGPDLSKPFITALEHSQMEAWDLTARALKKEQMERLRLVIREWRARNPEVQVAAFSRFTSGSWYESSSTMSDIRGSLGGILDPLQSTTKTVAETRHSAEQMFFYAKRLPTLLEWQAVAAAGEITDLSLMNHLMTELSSATASITRLPGEVRSFVPHVFLAAAALITLTFLLLGGYKGLSHWLEARSRGHPKGKRRKAAVNGRRSR